MKTRYLVGSGILLVIITGIVFVLWLAYTPDGTSFLMRSASRIFADTIEFGRTTGTVGHSLKIEQLKLHLSEAEVTIQSVSLKWQPLHILIGRLAIAYLHFNNISVSSRRPDDEPVKDLSLPRVSRWFSFVHGQIEHIAVAHAIYTAAGEEPFRIEHISAGLLWRKGVLYANELQIRLPFADIDGDAALGLINAGIRTRLNIDARHEVAEIDHLFIDARLPAARGEEQIAGPLLLKASKDGMERYALSGRFGLTHNAVRINNMKVVEIGRKGHLQADGSLVLTGKKPSFDVTIRANEIRIAEDAEIDLYGQVDARGTFDEYTGTVSLNSNDQGWKSFELQGNLSGNTAGMKLSRINGNLLGGAVTGAIKTSWISNISILANIRGQNLNPSLVHADIKGNLNTEINARLQFGESGLEGSVLGSVFKSQILDRQVSATIDAAFGSKLLKINTFKTEGDGFAISAHGILQKQLSYTVQVDDGASLVPDSRGNLFAKGWMRWADGRLAGTMEARARDIVYQEFGVSSLRADIEAPDGYDGIIKVNAVTQNTRYGDIHLDFGSLMVSGMTANHNIRADVSAGKHKLYLEATGGYTKSGWTGTIQKFSGEEPLSSYKLERPTKIILSGTRYFVSPSVLTSTAGERLNISIDIAPDGLIGSANAEWNQLNLARLNTLVHGSRFAGRTSGSLSGKRYQNGELALAARIHATTTLTHKTMMFRADAEGYFSWDKSGLSAKSSIALQNRGQIDLTMKSKAPAVLALPDQGSAQVTWKSVDLSVLGLFLPERIYTKGHMQGEMAGSLLPGRRFEIYGTSRIEGSASLRNIDGEITALMREVKLRWTWKNRSLDGQLGMALAQNGSMETTFSIPLAANIPVEIDRSAPISIFAKGNVREKGLISALLPGLVQETSGDLDFTLTGKGTIENPQINGSVDLNSGGAYFPSAGIQLKDVNARVIFDDKLISLTSLDVRSGSGYLRGTATARLQNWRVSDLQGGLKGERFQVINVPEVQASVSPDLSFRSDNKTVAVSGVIRVPEAMFRQELQERLIKPSPDVVISGSEVESKKHLLPLSAQVSVVLGDRIFVNAYGVDTRLTGTVSLSTMNFEDISARGTISTVNGKYEAYGVKLDITRGQIVFPGGPLERAALNVLATREIEDVVAGVNVTGTVTSPLVNLYSRPAMSDMDVLSYITLGRPGNYGETDMALLARAAGTLLTSRRGSGAGLTQGLQKRLGLDTIALESRAGGLTDSIVRIGKYLSPKLYVSYGRSIFTGENIVGIRYSLSKKLNIESEMGTQSSVLMYYRIEFD
ncbi:MAG TPA: translocation/assembly module TamB domain-containing protein [Syntrophorhabdaceae bacterium]|nr:translocation/assembly module TamB domain-containing protein [Syntrophorhabdaceae bacterium]